MSGHATAESLSRYLDAQLPAGRRREVEGHLESCTDCRHRLDGLRRVVHGLGRLPTAAPPEELAVRVRHEIGQRELRDRWPRLSDGRLPGTLLGSPPLHILALVLALAAIVVLFAKGLESRRDRPTRIVPVSGGSFAGPATGPATAGSAGGESLYLLGGRFRLRGGVWVEEGLAERAPDSRVRLDAAMPIASGPMPEVADLAALGVPLRLRVGDQVVEIVFGPAAATGE